VTGPVQRSADCVAVPRALLRHIVGQYSMDRYHVEDLQDNVCCECEKPWPCPAGQIVALAHIDGAERAD